MDISDIIAKVKCQGAEEVCPKNDIPFLPILLLDGSIGVGAFNILEINVIIL